jgi:hypothetical protein
MTNYLTWFAFVESKIFSKQIGELPAEVLRNIQFDLIQDPKRGDIVKGTHGVRKARVADPGSSRGKSGSYRYHTFISSTPAEFTCYIYSAKVTKPTCHRIKRALSAC